MHRHFARVAELYLVLAVLFLVSSLGRLHVELRQLKLVQGRGDAAGLARLDPPHQLVVARDGALVFDGAPVTASELAGRVQAGRPVAVFAEFPAPVRGTLGELYSLGADVLLGVSPSAAEGR